MAEQDERGRGRPRLPEAERLQHMVRTRLNRVQLARLEELCSKTGRSKSAVVRMLLMRRSVSSEQDAYETRTMLQVGLILKRLRPSDQEKFKGIIDQLREIITRRLS